MTPVLLFEVSDGHRGLCHSSLCYLEERGELALSCRSVPLGVMTLAWSPFSTPSLLRSDIRSLWSVAAGFRGTLHVFRSSHISLDGGCDNVILMESNSGDRFVRNTAYPSHRRRVFDHSRDLRRACKIYNIRAPPLPTSNSWVGLVYPSIHT